MKRGNVLRNTAAMLLAGMIVTGANAWAADISSRSVSAEESTADTAYDGGTTTVLGVDTFVDTSEESPSATEDETIATDSNVSVDVVSCDEDVSLSEGCSDYFKVKSVNKNKSKRQSEVYLTSTGTINYNIYARNRRTKIRVELYRARVDGTDENGEAYTINKEKIADKTLTVNTKTSDTITFDGLSTDDNAFYYIRIYNLSKHRQSFWGTARAS